MTATSPTLNDKNLVWMDLEMTGLDPEKERIIEIAVIITDGDLNVIAEGPDLVVHQSAKLLKAMDEWNQTQHAKSGLIEKVRASKISEEEAERRVLEFIARYVGPKVSPLCGNSIHHDRRFLIKYMPKLSDYLHYRHVDVTTVKALVQRWYPSTRRYIQKKEKHRALNDVKESIAELKYLREHYFVKR
jgi:oligoribonuclease